MERVHAGVLCVARVIKRWPRRLRPRLSSTIRTPCACCWRAAGHPRPCWRPARLPAPSSRPTRVGCPLRGGRLPGGSGAPGSATGSWRAASTPCRHVGAGTRARSRTPAHRGGAPAEAAATAVAAGAAGGCAARRRRAPRPAHRPGALACARQDCSRTPRASTWVQAAAAVPAAPGCAATTQGGARRAAGCHHAWGARRCGSRQPAARPRRAAAA